MRCIKCGQQLTNEQVCPSCGTDNSTVQKHPVPDNICCPDCGSRELRFCPITDSKTQGSESSAGGSRSLVQLLHLGASPSANGHIWVCTECDREFRDPTELKDEIDGAIVRIKRIPSIITIGSFALILLSLLFEWFLVAGIAFGLFFIVMFFFFRCFPAISADTQQKEEGYYKLKSDMRKFLS